MPNNQKRSKSRTKRLSQNNNIKIKKKDQEAKQILLGKKKLSMEDAKKRGYTYKPTDFGNLEISMMRKCSDDYQRNLVRKFQSVKEAAKGAFKCGKHNFDTDYFHKFYEHLLEKKHYLEGSLICKKCKKPKILKNFLITKMGLKKVQRLRCDHCKKYLMIKLIRDSWGIIYPEVVG